MSQDTIAGYVLRSKEGKYLTHDFFWTEVDYLDDASAFSPEDTICLIKKSLVDDWNVKIYTIIPVVKVDGEVVAMLNLMYVSSLIQINLRSSD